MSVPPVLCITGESGSGKTRLLERLIPRLVSAGLRVAAVKHAGHVDVGPAGKDSNRLGQAGATPAIAVSPDATIVRHPDGETELPDLAEAYCSRCNIVLAEGFSRSVHDKIVISPGGGSPARATDSAALLVGDGPGCEVRRDDIDAVAEWVLQWHRRRLELREDLVGVVLTGGTSRRMGTDKSQLRFAGRSTLVRLCELLIDRLGEAWIVGRRPVTDALPKCVRWHPDVAGGLGPLGGIATALHVAASGPRPGGACVLACDMPAVGPRLLDCLLSARRRESPATVMLHPATGRVEPLPGIYEADAATSIAQSIEAGRLSVTAWLDEAEALAFAAPAELAWRLANINTPADLETLESRMQDGRE